MKSLTIKRISPKQYPNNKGTFGVFINNKTHIPFAVTLEPPWKNNQINISCIPDGIYFCERIWSDKIDGHTYRICDVLNRTGVVFHPGNRAQDTKACILVAEEYGQLWNDPAIITSRNKKGKGFNEFINILDGDFEFQLIISWC